MERLHLCTKCSLCLWNKVRGSKIDNTIILYAIPIDFGIIWKGISWATIISMNISFSNKFFMMKNEFRKSACNNVWIHAWLGREFGNQWDILLKQISNESVKEPLSVFEMWNFNCLEHTLYSVDAFPHEITTHCWQCMFYLSKPFKKFWGIKRCKG